MSKTTKLQRDIAKALGIDINNDSETVASARIRQHVAPAIGEKAYDEPATQKQIDFAASIGLDVSDVEWGQVSG